ncbi:MAG: hypothetical protein ACKKMO_02565 [Candidatus Nealsonbacteria bacterium]
MEVILMTSLTKEIKETKNEIEKINVKIEKIETALSTKVNEEEDTIETLIEQLQFARLKVEREKALWNLEKLKRKIKNEKKGDKKMREKDLEGLSLEELFCPFCGAQLRLTGSFCAYCGTGFEEMDGEVVILARQRIAQKIMGNNFFGINNAIEHFKVNPTEQDLKALAEIPFSEQELNDLKNDYILAAVFPLSVIDIRKMNAKLFYDQSWYNDESFAKERGKAGWQLIRKTPAPNSTSKSWSKQQKLLAKDDEVPTAQVMVYTIIGHYLATGEHLFKDIRVRTFSLASGGRRVNVGNFNSGGLDISYVWDDYRFSNLGLAPARKFD